MKIREELFHIKGAPIKGVNPLPKFRTRLPQTMATDENFPDELKEGGSYQTKVLPYLTQDRYDRSRVDLSLQSFVLENEFLSARFLPQYGGRLHSLYDKVLKKELLFTNPVIQPGNLAIRNAWLSGGIEWNIGCFGHTYTTCDNVFAAILDDGEGNEFLRIYEFERNKSIFWQVDFHLPEGSRHLIAHVRMVNPFDKATTTYWWSNVAVPTTGKTRVLASNKNVISFCSGICKFETLPHVTEFGDIDATYPENAPRAFDYFIQKNEDGESTWEAAAYDDGTVFYERSTAPLYYKKLFAWGNHKAGKHWQEFLSDGVGTGYYAELQAGIAPSQLHDKLLPAGGKYEWTQCFGGVAADREMLFDEDYHKAVAYFGATVDFILSADGINALNERLIKLADIPVRETDLRHMGSGFGALEIKRMKLDGDGTAPENLLFPISALAENEKPWLSLLECGKYPEVPAAKLPTSYMTSMKWFPRIKAAAENEGGYLANLYYGVARYELQSTEQMLDVLYRTPVDETQTAESREIFLRSLACAESVSAYRNLAVIEAAEGNLALAEEYYDKAMALPEVFDDFALCSEFLLFLNGQKKYEKVWRLFLSMPEEIKSVDRIRISAATAAVKLGELDFLKSFFEQSHHDIREGENSLTDIWFEYCARKMANERQITELTEETLEELLDEAWETCPPDYSIDFRMSYSRRNKYRV